MAMLFKVSILAGSFLLLASCAEKSSDNHSKTKLAPRTNQPVLTKEPVAHEILKTQLKKVEQAPSLTVIMLPKKDLQDTLAKVKSEGGKIIYDPNNGIGGDIPFFIAELTPDQINNTKFIKSLNLKSASIDSKFGRAKPIETKITSAVLDFTNYIPTDSVKIDELGEKTSLGKGITVAVIDTGIDASHPAFGDRVVYWYDGTQETRTKFKKVKVSGPTIDIATDGKVETIKIPEILSSEKDIYIAVMSEKNFSTQLDEETKHEIGFYDLNHNKRADNFLVLASKTESGFKVYFDENADMKLGLGNASELKAKIDYNQTTKLNRSQGMVTIPTRNNIIKYPVLIEEEGGEFFIGLGKTEGMHGTHVAGIIAADDQANNLLGAAPQADLMSLKVCSGISCTDSAIIKGLYKAFYNGKVIPDVVNISLGSHEKYKRDVYSYVMNDLSAKFGTIFFISASNSGPGFRSLNHFGDSGAVVMVGANVSEKTLGDQYNLPDGERVQRENLLFFSSLGPTYTSEMKPNIIAPGAAISAVPVAGDYMSQANGTSMSSPLAAGAFAAILGKVKEENPNLIKIIERLRKIHTEGAGEANGSLLPYVYAMRDSLHNGAEEQPNLTRVQQGYGLLQSGKTKDLLLSYLEELNQKDREYFEVVINDYKKTYDRSGEEKEIQSFKLTIGNDGERTKAELAKIISKGIDIELSRVEVIDSLGKVKVLTGAKALKYFAILSRGNSNQNLLKTHVTFNNRRTPSFLSRRFFQAMENGKSYLAHYKINHGDANVGNIIDVVHRPIPLKKQKVSVASISPTKLETSNGFSRTGIKIGANEFHRYPVYIDGQTNKLTVKAAIANHKEGRLYLQVYDPSGEEIEIKIAENSPITPFSIAEAEISTIKKGKIQTGVWEITIASSSSTWLSATEYDLLVEGNIFGPNINRSLLSKGQDLVLPIQLGEAEGLDKVLIKNAREVITDSVEVKSNYISYQPLKIREGYTGKVQIKVLEKHTQYWGSLLPKLYLINGDDITEYQGDYSFKEDVFVIKKVPNETLYYALDTITNYGEFDDKLDITGKVEVEVLTKSLEKVDIEAIINEVSNQKLALTTLKLKSELKTKHTRVEINFISGEIEEYTDINGNQVIRLGEDVVLSKIDLDIK